MNTLFALLVVAASLASLNAAKHKLHPHAVRAYLAHPKSGPLRQFNDPLSMRPTSFPRPKPSGGFLPTGIPPPVLKCVIQCHQCLDKTGPRDYCEHVQCLYEASLCIIDNVPEPLSYVPEEKLDQVACCGEKVYKCLGEACSCKGELFCAFKFGVCAEILE